MRYKHVVLCASLIPFLLVGCGATKQATQPRPLPQLIGVEKVAEPVKQAKFDSLTYVQLAISAYHLLAEEAGRFPMRVLIYERTDEGLTILIVDTDPFVLDGFATVRFHRNGLLRDISPNHFPGQID